MGMNCKKTSSGISRIGKELRLILVLLMDLNIEVTLIAILNFCKAIQLVQVFETKKQDLEAIYQFFPNIT